MSGSKNLEQLFRERFENFEAAPPEHVWENIEEKLREKKKRRLIPFWFKAAGIAATLLIGFLTADYFSDQKPADNKVVVAPSEIPARPALGNPDNATIASGTSIEDNISDNGKTNNSANDNSGASINSIKKSEAIVDRSNSKDGKSAEKNQNASFKKTDNKTSIVVSEKRKGIKENSEIIDGAVDFTNKTKTSSKLDSPNNDALSQKPSDAIAHHSILEKRKLYPNKESQLIGKSISEKNILNNNVFISLNDNVSDNDKYNNKNISREAEKRKNIAVIENLKSDESNKNITDDITIKLDTTSVVAVAEKVVPNALEELLNEKENNVNGPEPKINRWQVSSNIAPIYLSSVSNGSPINSEFANNPKEYENNLSYGVGVNYNLNKKLSVRTGVNRFTLGYNTNDVVVYAGVESKNLENVNLTPQSRNLNIEDRGIVEPLSAKPSISLETESETSKFNGVLNQQMGYIEVPMELTYKLLDKKFGVNFIGGLSTLFLDKNEVSVVSNGLVSEIGEANNLNKVHFSTNVGLGLHYNIYKTIKINVEPMLKYQINSFSSDAGSFKPYFFGIYSGIGFSF